MGGVGWKVDCTVILILELVATQTSNEPCRINLSFNIALVGDKFHHTCYQLRGQGGIRIACIIVEVVSRKELRFPELLDPLPANGKDIEKRVSAEKEMY
jgi:hypothetical protein